MKTIYKYALDNFDEKTGYGIVKLPINFEILKVDRQNENLFAWALIDSEKEQENFLFRIFKTGYQLNPGIKKQDYWGTYFHGPLVWHVFQVR